LHNAEIKKLLGKVNERRLTIVPLRIYFKAGKAKVELALAKGKRLYDKRQELKRRAARREVEQVLKGK
jgi:SsrA-binding protein